MTENKLKRIIVASTVGAVLLMLILLSIMIYQLISIKVQKDIADELDRQYKTYQQLIKEGEETIEARSMREWIEREARKLGLSYEFD
jgi:Na+/melibiose symporter-like transporter